MRRFWQHHLERPISIDFRSWLFAIYRAVKRRVFLARDALAGIQDSIKCFTGMIRKARAGVQCIRFEPTVHQKIEGVAIAHGHPAL